MNAENPCVISTDYAGQFFKAAGGGCQQKSSLDLNGCGKF